MARCQVTCGPFWAQVQLLLKYVLRVVYEAISFIVLTVGRCCCKFDRFTFDKPVSSGHGTHLSHSNANNFQEAFNALRQSLSNLGQNFHDTSFSQAQVWMTGESVQWKRCNAPMWDAEKGPSPSDAVQGQLGTCYFMCSLAAMAEVPSRITRLYVGSNADGSAHGVLLFFRGQWTGVVVDNLFPYFTASNEPAACQSITTSHVGHRAQAVMWPALFEKAWAKLNGSAYSAIEGGLPSFALHALSSFPARHMDLIEYSRDEIWSALCAAHGTSSIVCADIKTLPLLTGCLPFSCGSWFGWLGQWWMELGAPTRLLYFFCRDFGRALVLLFTLPFALFGDCVSALSYWWHINTSGLVETHAYSILEAEVVPYLCCSNTRLVKIRNPHGTGEWKRRWSDSSLCWSINSGAAEKVKYESSEDGVFFMDLDDFIEFISGISVCSFGVPSIEHKNTIEEIGSVPLPPTIDGKTHEKILTQWSSRFQISQRVASFRLAVPHSDEPVWAVIGAVDCKSTNGFRETGTWALKVWSTDSAEEIGGSGETVYNETSCTELAWRNSATIATQTGLMLQPGKQYLLAVYVNGELPLDCLLLTSTSHAQPVQIIL